MKIDGACHCGQDGRELGGRGVDPVWGRDQPDRLGPGCHRDEFRIPPPQTPLLTILAAMEQTGM